MHGHFLDSVIGRALFYALVITIAGYTYVPAQQKVPNLHILTIGVSKFNISNFDLLYAHKDAMDIASAFQVLKGIMYNSVYPMTLTNKEATAGGIRGAFGRLKILTEHKPDDLCIVFISTHALSIDGTLYFIVNDTRQRDLASPNRDRMITLSEFSDMIDALQRRVIIFIDACHSGRSNKEFFSHKNNKLGRANIVQYLTQRRPQAAIVVSSQDDEKSRELKRGTNGIFTRAIIEGLRDRPAGADYDGNGSIALSELSDYLNKKVNEYSQRDWKEPQTAALVYNSVGNPEVYRTSSYQYRVASNNHFIERFFCSSSLPPASEKYNHAWNDYTPVHTLDGNPGTAWIEGDTGNGKGQWLLFTLKDSIYIKKLGIFNGYGKSDELFSSTARVKTIRIQMNGYDRVHSLDTLMKYQEIPIIPNARVKYIKLTIMDVFSTDSKKKHAAISEILLY